MIAGIALAAITATMAQLIAFDLAKSKERTSLGLPLRGSLLYNATMRLNVEYSTEKDVQTHLNLGFKFNALAHGRKNPREDLLNKYNPELKKIILDSTSEEEAKEQITKYLTKYKRENEDKIKRGIKRLEDEWEIVGDAIINSLENLYKKPWPFEEITVYLTTNKIFQYNYEKRYFFADIDYLLPQLSIAKHELNHFMFYYYYPNLIDKLGKEKYELLKESLTYFSNPEQRGKPNEDGLRKLYSTRIWENLDKAIMEGVKFLNKH